MQINFWLRCQVLVLVVGANILIASSTIAAEQVALKYRIFRESISVNELSTFAETGKLSTSLRANLELAKQDPKMVRWYLSQTVQANPAFLDRVLNSGIGDVMLDQLSQVIHTPSHRADLQALRSALILCASRDGNVSLIKTIQIYPSTQVEVEGDRLESAYVQLRRLRGNP